jgi:hypothetical protein
LRRALRPRATESVVVAPVAITDLTAPHVVGLEPRAFRELVADLGIPHVRRGHRTLVDVEVFRRAIAAAAGSDAPSMASAEERDAPRSTASSLLHRLGRERIASGGRT